MIDPRSQSQTKIQSGKHTTIHLLLTQRSRVKGQRLIVAVTPADTLERSMFIQASWGAVPRKQKALIPILWLQPV